MPTLEQIKEIHDQLGNADSLPEYLEALRAIGVLSYDSFITDGHSEYHCEDDEKLISVTEHKEFTVADTVNKDQFLHVLDLSAKGNLGYFEMSEALASSGVERWRFDTEKMSMTYLDKAGNVLLHEQISG